MTYWGFHLLFTLPLLVLTAFWSAPWHWPAEKFLVAGGLLAIVTAFTAPWDTWAVKRKIWEFHPRKTGRRIGVLPVEEYAFFWIQSLIVIGFVDGLAQRFPEAESAVSDPQVLRFGGTALVLAVAVAWLWLKPRIALHPQYNYTWHLLAWFLPVIAGQWVLGAHIFLPRLGFILLPTFVVGTWLCYADWRAIQQGIWYFDVRQVTGHYVLRLVPWEEVAFFYLTSLLVAQSWLLLVPEALR